MKRILLIWFSLLSITCSAQTIQYLGGPTTQIYVRGQLRVDSLLFLPLRDTNVTPTQIGVIVVKGSSPYVWVGTRWSPIALGAPVWGTITGTLSDQTDLQSALNAKQDAITAGYGIAKTGSTIKFDSANVRKVDTVYRVNDSTLGYKINGGAYTFIIRGSPGGTISSITLTAPTALFNSPVTFINTSGAWSGALTMPNQNANTFFRGPTTGSPAQPAFGGIVLADLPTGIPNGNLANSAINFGIGSSGTSPNWASVSASLGGTATLNLPTVSSANTGIVTPTLFNTWNSKVDSTIQSNDSVYEFRNGTRYFRYIIVTGGGGITSLNGLTGSTQTFANGASGTTPAFVSSGTTHTLNVPLAASSSVTSGTISHADYLSFTGKEPAIAASNTPNQYWNGYKLFVGLNTDSITEGSTNLFFTNARARNAISAASPLSYNSGTGVISYTPTLTYTKNATNNTIAITGGNTITLTPADATHAGLLDTARVAWIDSGRNLLLQDTVNYRQTGTGTPIFSFSTNGSQSTLSFPAIRDTSAQHSAYAPDSALTIADHDSTSVNGLQPIYRTDTMRTHLYNALAGKQGNLTLTTTGTSGAATLISNTLNIPQYSSYVDPLTTNGDIVARVSGSTTRLAQGANNTFLGVSGGTLGYYAPFILTTTGTSGAATYSGGTLNIPQYSSGGGGTAAGPSKSVQIKSATTSSFGNVPNFTADSTTATVNADTLITHKVKVDSAIWTVPTWGTPDKMYFLGDSWTFGVRPDGTVGLFKTRLGVYYNLPVTDVSASGTGIAQAVFSFNAETIPVSHFTHVLTGLNDPRYSTNLAMAATLNEIINGHWMLYCIQYAKTSIQANTTGSGIRRGGSGWTNTVYNDRLHTGRGTGVQTAIQNDSIMLDFTDSTAYFAVVGSDVNGATFDVFIDTVKIYQLTSNARADGQTKLGVVDHYIEFPVIVRGLSYAAHTLKLVKTSSSTSDTLRVDFGGVMKGVRDANSTPMLICEQPYLDATGYGTSPNGSSLTTARTANVKLDSFFYSRGVDRRYPFRLGRENQGFAQGENQGQGQGQDTLRTISTDHIHPNSLGDTGQVRICVNQFPTLDPGRFLAKVKPNGQYLRTNYSGADRDLAYEDEISMFFAQDLASLTATTGAINVSNNTIAMGTSSNGTTVGNSPITISSGTNVGIGQSSATSVLDILTTNNGIRVKNSNTAIGMGLFSSSGAIWFNRDYTSGTINSASIPSVALEGTNGGRFNIWTGTTNGAAGTQWWSVTGTGHLIGGISAPSDNTSFGNFMVLQPKGGLMIDAYLSIYANQYSFLHRGNGQFGYIDAGNTVQYLGQIDSTDHAWIFGITNGTHSYTSDTAFRITNGGDVKFVSGLQVIKATHNVVVGYNATDDGLNKLQAYGTGKITDTLKLTKLPNKASLAGTDSVLIADASGNVHKVPSSAVGGVTTVGAFSGSSQTNGASISTNTITFGPADATNPGMVSTGAQTWAGVKTFNSSPIIPTATAGDNSTKAASTAYVDGAVSTANINKFSQTADGTVSNTTSTTSIIGTGTGSQTIAANTLAVGKRIIVKGFGYLSTDASVPTLTITFTNTSSNAGNAVGALLSSSMNNTPLEWEYAGTVRTIGSGGTIQLNGWISINGTKAYIATSTPFAFNTTVSQTFDITALWGTASANNIIVSKQTFISVE